MFVSLFVCSINSLASFERMPSGCASCVVMKELHCHRPSFHKFVCTLVAWMWRSSTQIVLERCVHEPAQSAWLGCLGHYGHLYAKRWFENVERCSTFFCAPRFIATSLRAANNYTSEMQRFRINTDWCGWRPVVHVHSIMRVKCSRGN